MQSNKYPNWQIEKDSNGYIMTRPDWEAQGTYYAVAVWQMGSEWIAELYTKQTVMDRREWGPAMHQASGTAAQVTQEAARRAQYWIAKRGQ